MKICAQVNVYNSELYLLYVLASIYNHVDRIVCIDGAFLDSMPSKYSTDNTEKIVRDFNDPDNKIVYFKTHSNSQIEQRNKVLKYLDGMDWLMICDDDELFHPEHLQSMRKYLETAKENSFRTTGFNFVNSFDWYYITCNMRIFKVMKGMNFKGPNSMKLNNDHDYYSQVLSPVIPELIRYHYSYVRKPERLDIKQKQAMEFQGNKIFPWVQNGEFVNRENLKYLKFIGKHPEILKDHPSALLKWEPKE